MTSEPSAARVPEVRFTEAAVAKLTEVISGQSRPVAGLRLQVVGREGGEFQHVLSLVEQGRVLSADLVSEVQGLTIFFESRSAPYLDGVEVHYEYRGPDVSGLHYFNPNPLWFDAREVQIQELFDRHINPAIASHGGWVELLAVEGTTAIVRLGGGCQGCGMADVTLKQGIEATILQVVEGIERVVDETDHASGQNPYHQPSKK